MRPVVGSLTERYYNTLLPLAVQDEALGWHLLEYCAALCSPIQEIEDMIRDTEAGPGWSAAVDPDRAPEKYLPWLAQFVGTQVGDLPNVADKRTRIKDAPGLKRGTPAAIIEAAQLYLTGAKTVYFHERDTSPYHFSVVTRDSESPKVSAAAGVPLTLSGDVITDAVRAARVFGDGRLEDGSIGVWEATTNKVTNGSFETNTNGWVLGGTVVRSNDYAKFGSYSLKVDAVGYNYGYVDIVATTGQVHYLTAWRKCVNHVTATGSGTTIACEIVSGSFVVTSEGAPLTRISAGNQDWELIVLRVHCTASGTARPVFTGNYGGTGSGFVYFDGVQVEQKSYATPYVHTDGATASRAATAGISGPASLLDQNQGWAALRVRTGVAWNFYAGLNPRLFEWGQYSDPWISMFYTSTSQFALGASVAGGDWAAIATTFAKNDLLTIVVAWTPTQLKISVNGSPFVVKTRPAYAVQGDNFFIIGGSGPGVEIFNGEYLWFACGTGILTDADAAAIDTMLDSGKEPAVEDLSPSSIPTAVMPMVSNAYTVPSSQNSPVHKALIAAKPAGLVMSYSTVPGQDYLAGEATAGTYAAAEATAGNYLTAEGSM